MVNSLLTFYQDSSQVATLRAIAPVVRIEGKLVAWLKPVELSRTLKDGLETARFELMGQATGPAVRIETLKKLCQPNRQVTITQVVLADPVSQARIEWELFRGTINEGAAEVSGDREGVELVAKNNWAVAGRIARRVQLALQPAGESLDIGQSNVVESKLKSLLDENGGHDFSGSVVLPWIHPDIWPGDIVERIDGRVLRLGSDRVVGQVTLRFGNTWTTTLVFEGEA